MKKLSFCTQKAFICLIAVVLTACSSRDKTLHIITTANLCGHGIEINDDHRINYLHVLAYKQYLENKGHAVLLLDSGSSFHGTLISSLDQGQAVLQSKELVGYSVMGLDNHDFDFGGDRLLELKALNSIPMIACNATYHAHNPFLSYYNVSFFESLELVVIGVIAPSTYRKVHEPNIHDWDFYDPVSIVNALIEQLKAKHKPIIIIGSLGDDSPEICTRLFQSIKNLALVIDSDKFYTENSLRQEETIEVASNASGLTHTILKIRDNHVIKNHSCVVDRHQIETLHLNYDSTEVQALKDFLSDLHTKNQDYIDEPIMALYKPLNGSRNVIRQPNAPLAQLAVNSQRSIANSEIALMNSGSVRSSLTPGLISRANIHDVLTFSNIVVSINLRGKDILWALELSCQNYPKNSSGFLHVSGMRYTLNPQAPDDQRISNIYVGDEPLDLERNYLVTINSYLLAGGDGYPMFKRPIVAQYTGDAETLITYLKRYGQDAIDEAANKTVTIMMPE